MSPNRCKIDGLRGPLLLAPFQWSRAPATNRISLALVSKRSTTTQKATNWCEATVEVEVKAMTCWKVHWC